MLTMTEEPKNYFKFLLEVLLKHPYLFDQMPIHVMSFVATLNNRFIEREI